MGSLKLEVLRLSSSDFSGFLRVGGVEGATGAAAKGGVVDTLFTRANIDRKCVLHVLQAPVPLIFSKSSLANW